MKVILLALFLLSYTDAKAQNFFKDNLSFELGALVGSQFIDKTYNYDNSNYGNNTLGGFGGLKAAAIYKHKYKIQFTWSNCDEDFIGSAPNSVNSYDKNFNSIVSISRVHSIKSSRIEFGLSYLYLYERTTFPVSNNSAVGNQFSSVDHYIGGHLAYKFVIGKSFGPFINYHLTPVRLSNEGAFGYSHNVNVGVSFYL
jgi:hypothetical protein